MSVFERLFIWLQQYSHMKYQLEIQFVIIRVLRKVNQVGRNNVVWIKKKKKKSQPKRKVIFLKLCANEDFSLDSSLRTGAYRAARFHTIRQECKFIILPLTLYLNKLNTLLLWEYSYFIFMENVKVEPFCNRTYIFQSFWTFPRVTMQLLLIKHWHFY